jgi:hypothetical protein
LKVNYGFERAQRKRTKEMKKQEKLRRREEETAKRKALKEGHAGEEANVDAPTLESPDEIK